MKHNTLVIALLTVLPHSMIPASQAGPFRNLDFESAILPVLPEGEYGSNVPVGVGLPGWSVFLGTNPVSSVLHNNLTLGPAAVSILGPDWPYGDGGRIDGHFTALLAGGGAPPDLSITQTGVLPLDARWLLFNARVYQFQSPRVFAVFLDGQEIPTMALETYSDYSLYGGDISSFAGSEAELRFTVFPGRANTLILDSIVFSPVPEPSSVLLTGVGLLAATLAWRCRPGSRRSGA